MGRNFLRRKTIVCAFIFLGISAGSVFPQSLPIHFIIPIKPHTSPSSSVITPLQGHKGPEVFYFPAATGPPVLKELRLYRNPYNFKLLVRLFNRSKTYRKLVMTEIEKRGLPPELFFIPFVESQWNPKALSRSGAAGLWQLMRVCVKKKPIIIDEWIDERYDFWKATETALGVLSDLHIYYRDWLLALAAYNCGITRLNHIIKRAGSRDFWTLYTKGVLPPQTADYVVRILALSRICSYPGRNGLPWDWDEKPQWCRVKIKSPVDLRKLSGTSGIPYKTLISQNPELKFRVTPPPSHDYRLKVPLHYKEQLEKALSTTAQNLIEYYIHTVYSGETLYGIARYYGISESLIRFYNRNVSASALKVGMKLVIPVVHANMPRPKFSRNFTRKQFVSLHIVSRGETLFTIAREYEVPVEELVYHNKLKLNSIIKAGDRLKVPYKITD